MRVPANEFEAKLANAGRFINAIKAYRERTGATLADAKAEIEEVRGYKLEACPHCKGTGQIRTNLKKEE